LVAVSWLVIDSKSSSPVVSYDKYELAHFIVLNRAKDKLINYGSLLKWLTRLYDSMLIMPLSDLLE
jgi:hypothetical protein